MTAQDQADAAVTSSACCAASRGGDQPALADNTVIVPSAATIAPDEMVLLPGGPFLMGTDDREGYPAAGEGPLRRTRLGPFWIHRAAVPNQQFAAFLEAPGSGTEAERCGWASVFPGLLPADFPPTRAVAQVPWWRQ